MSPIYCINRKTPIDGENTEDDFQQKMRRDILGMKILIVQAESDHQYQCISRLTTELDGW